MKQCLLSIIAVLCLVLSGCSWMDGHYVSVTPHQEHLSANQSGDAAASDYLELREALENMVNSGLESAVINVSEYRQEMVERGIRTAAHYIRELYPLGAYAVDQVEYEIGTVGGQPAVAVNISYVHGRSEILKVQKARSMERAEQIVEEVLGQCSEGITLLITDYEDLDWVQMVEDYTKLNPDTVMELPQVAVGIYPDAGSSRVVELKFTYQTSRDSLRHMQDQVSRIFASAALYINSDASDGLKYEQLYNFLMERSDYQIETSITPAYSLLSHGVGDSEAFAMVYAAMCRQAGLNCQIVSGTREGEPRYWNLIQENGVYYHLDLLQSSDAGHFRKMTEAEMQGYVWDYSAYTGEEAE